MRTMKLFLLFVLILGVSADISVGSNGPKFGGNHVSMLGGVSDIINQIISKALDSMRNIIPEPMNLSMLNISLPYEDLANGTFTISDLVETGARNFNASVVKANVLKSTLNVVLDFPSINVNTDYFADLLFGSILPMYGEGPVNIRLKNLRFNLTSKYKLNILKLQMKIQNTSLIISVGDAVFDIHGMINNEGFSILCSQILDDTVGVFINKHNVLISKIISPVIESVVNSYLSGSSGNKTLSAALENFQPPEMEESNIMELRHLFIKELMKNPLVSKFVSI